MKKVLLSLAMAMALMAPSALQAKVKHLLPKPQQITATENAAPLTLGGTVTISYSGGAEKCDLLEEFFTTNGCSLAESGGTAVNVSLVESIEGAYDYELYGYENEAYTLDVSASGITITAVTPTGIIRAAQTLTQMAEGWDGQASLEAVSIKDWPAFKLRGYMHDVGRSFISADELVKQVEKFSRFKVNTFHWHMTENQAWRFKVNAYPELTSTESMTRFAGQYYTQEDCKKVLEAAKKHGMLVIPEIDMPGHSEAFQRAMGFGMQTEEGKAVLKKVLDEVCEVFADAPYIHIGGDEVATTADYLNEMIAYVESKGKKVEIWNPINGVGQDALNATYAQMWGTRGYLASGKANIDSRYNYTNHFDVFADLVGIYKSSIYYSEKGNPEVAGAVSGCWNDRKVADEKAIMAQNNVWANVIATAERAWIGGGKQYIDNATNTPDAYKANPYGGGVMLPNSGEEYEEFKSWEERFLFHKANSLNGEPIPYVKQTNVRWRITDAFPNGGSETAAFGPEEAGMTASTDLLPEVFNHDGKTYYTGMATGAGIYLAHTWGNSIINAYYSNPQYNHTAYAWTYVYSDKEQKVGAQIEFQNYSRSEQDGAAPAGKWDHFGSKIWINGEEIAAPTWDNTGVSISSKEVELKNENFPGRKPIEVTLKQGWNKVFMKLPYFYKGYRLKKWMFTCVFTDTEGVNAVDGLIYSPNQCMDEATEAVAAEISNIKRNRGNLIGTAVGLWPESAAAALDAKVAEIEATYSETKTAEERAAQVTALAEAWSAFAASLTGDKINLPVSGNYYRMYTPLRDSRYPTGKGAGAAIVGEQNPTTKASIWQFVSRGDNSYDIINLADGTYISPASNNNTAINTIADKPNAGWTIKSAGAGKVIVTSGTTQFNQTNSGQGYKLYNWGYNSDGFPNAFNTSDGGCLYELIDVTAIAEATPIKSLASYEEFENGGVYSFVTERGWMGATASSNNAISTAKTTVSPAASADNPYFQWTVYQSKNGNYYLYNIGKEMFMGLQSSNNASVPLVDSPAGKQLTFKNSSSTTYPIMFSTDNAGVVNHSPNHGEGLVTWTDGWSKLDDAGSNHQVALICTLDDEALAKIAELVEAYDVYDESASAAPQPFVKLECLEKKSYPYAIDDVLADKVFAETDITIALDVTMPASLANNTRYALACAADPTQNVTGATKTNSPYVAYGLNGSYPAYLPSSASGDKFTYRDFSFAGNTNYKVVYVIDRTNKKFSIYVDGALKSSADYPVDGYELQSFSNFTTNVNAKFYIGGGIVSNTTAYDNFGGAIHSVQFFDEALTTEKIALIKYPLTQDQQNELRVVEKLYRPTKRVTVLESGKKYMIYDTAEGRTGFIKNAGTSLSHSGTNAQSKPGTFSGDESYIWTVSAADAANYKYYLKASNGKYVNATGNTENATGQDIYIQPWKTSTATKSESNSESEEGTITPNAEIGEGVWTISGSKVGNEGQNCWNGNSGSWAKWSNCHPYAFYDYELQASIEIPQNALTYYIAADALQSDGSYAKHYLYNNNGTLATSATYVRDDAKYMWTATVDAEGNYTFANGAGQYLGYGASGSGLCMTDAPVSLNISKDNAVHVGSLGMLRIGTDNAGKWMVTKVDGTGFNRNSGKVNNGSWTSDYTFAYVNGTERMLTIVNNTPNSVARYSWNGKEFDATLLFEGNEEVTDATLQCVSHNAAYTFVGFYSDENFTKQVTSIAELTEDMTLYAKFELAIFSASYGSKWINIARSADANHLAILNSSDANAAPIFNIADYANEGILWCFVGNSESFKIYNKVSGETLALTPSATPAREVTVKMVAAADAQSWHLIKYDNGYVITPVGNTSHGINSYGGNDKLGGELKFWDASDGGTHWNFNLLELLAIKAEADDWNESNPNTHFGSVRITNNGGSALAKLTLSNRVASNIIYTAAKDDAEVDFTRAYRGFEFQGYWLGDEKLGSNFTLTEELKAAITEQNPLIAKFTTTDDVTLFYDDDEYSYRIPAIGKTSTGRLIAVSDYRHNLDDIGRDVHGTDKLRIDLVMRYSDDNGKTWSDKKTIAEGSGNKNADGYDCAYGDAAIATVGQNVLVMAAAGNVVYSGASADKHNRTVRVFSADNGATWTKEDISEKMFIGENALIPNGHAAFFGSGKLAVDENFNGTGKARIYGAMLVKNASTTTNIYPIYTDDLGQNWKILGGSTNPVANADEPKVEIMPNGQILLSARRQGGRHFRVFTYGTGENDKANGNGSWGDAAANGCGNGGSNGTNGEIFLVNAKKSDGTDVKLLLQSQPKGGSGHYDRKNVTIWYKEVDANTAYTVATIKDNWTEGLQVSTQQSSYSAMALQDDGKVAFFFEEAPCYGDDYTKGYSMVYVPLTIEAITKDNYKTPEVKEEDDEVTSADALPGDGTLRFYRLAIPVTKSAYEEDLESSYDKVKAFWQECEQYINKVFVPLGFCFDVIESESLVGLDDLAIGNSGLPEIGNCTYDLNGILGEANYDVAMWVTHRDDFEENSGLSALGGAYTPSQKGSGYAKTDKWVVAHELGHMFGAVHTLQGEGSLMDNMGEYFSYPSIKAIRNSAIGATSYNNIKVSNNAPQFDEEKMKQTYRIPQGACLAIDVQATDIEKHKLMYTAIGCNSENVDNVQEGKDVTLPFASFAPQESNVISYAPIYTADIVDTDFFLLKEGTGIHEMEAGTYPLSILVNDVPSADWTYDALTETPFYSTYAIWETEVEVVDGTAFKASIASDKTNFTAGEKVTVKWGVNENYFTADSRVRITMSDDYGKTFEYVLAESVEALSGECTVTMPNVEVGQVDVDFSTAVRKMNAGIIKVEEIGANAFTLTVLAPNTDKGFTLDNTSITSYIGTYKMGTFYANDPMTIPSGVRAYVATTLPVMDGDEGTIAMTAIEGIIPANTGALLCAEEGEYVFTKAESEGTPVTGNMLCGYAGANEYAEVEKPEGSTNYVLAVEDGKVGFYKKDSAFKVYNNKAYLNLPASVAAARAIYFSFDDDETGIWETENEGQKTENCYDLSGRRVEKAQKGVYIVNGKKVVR